MKKRIIIIISSIVVMAFVGIFVYLLQIKNYEGSIQPHRTNYELNYVKVPARLFEPDYEESAVERNIMFHYFPSTVMKAERSYSIYNYRYKTRMKEITTADISQYEKLAGLDKDVMKSFASFATYYNESDINTLVWHIQSFNLEEKFFTLGKDIPKYPIQTLYELGGNSADKAVMLFAILRTLGYESELLYNEQLGKMAVGIGLEEKEPGMYILENGIKYGFIDVCNPGFDIGYTTDDISGYRIFSESHDEKRKLYSNAHRKDQAYERMDGNTIVNSFTMNRLYKNSDAQVFVEFNKDDYAFYSRMSRYPWMDSYENYLTGEVNEKIIKKLVQDILETCTDEKTGEWYKICAVINFVHNIPYQYDKDLFGINDYAQYPIETLANNAGDCEDHAILLAAMLQEMQYDVKFVRCEVDENGEKMGHVMLAVKDKYNIFSGGYFDIDGEKYYLIETVTMFSQIGQVPRNIISDVFLME